MHQQVSRRLALGLLAGAAITPTVGRAQLHEDAIQRAFAEVQPSPQRSLTILQPAGSEANLRPVIARFNEMTGIAVQVRSTDVDEINTTITEDTLLEAADYDIALPATYGIADLVSAGAIQSLDPFLARWPDTYDRAGQLYTHGDRFAGRTYGFQTDGDVYLMFYRKDLMTDPRLVEEYRDRYGVGIEVPTDWDELDRQLAFFHRPDENIWGSALFRTPDYLGWEFIARLAAAGETLFDDSFRPQLRSERSLAVLVAMIAANASLHPDAQSAGLFENWKLFSENRIYCNIGWGGSQKYFNRPGGDLQGNLVHAPMPKGQGRGGGYFNWGWSYVIPRRAPQPELSFLFAALAVSEQVSTRAVREVQGFFDPFHEVHYSDPTIREVYSDAFLAVHYEAMKAAQPDLYLPGYGNYMATLNQNLNAALLGEITARGALSRVQSEWESISLNFDRELQMQTWAQLRKAS